MPWFYRCQEKPERDPDCPLRIWKDTSGRYIDRAAAKTLLRDGKTGALEGFTARNGRTYQAMLEIDREAWQVKIKPVAWEEGSVSDVPEYEVNTEPVGTCPFEEECQVVESSTHFICERKLKEADLGEGVERPKSCGFIFPRTVCKREITRDEALHYLTNRRTELLTDFTSRYGRPFSATLVLKETGGTASSSRRGAACAEGARGRGRRDRSAEASRARSKARERRQERCGDRGRGGEARSQAHREDRQDRARKPKAKTPKTDD